MDTYFVAEKFKSVQGEGVYAGVPMAFIRFIGCSVGKRICQHCDTDFDEMYPWLGGGEFTAGDLLEWVGDYDHVCLTGGEPLDHDLSDIFAACYRKVIHIETSGTVLWKAPAIMGRADNPRFSSIHLTVSPKPGWLPEMITAANEIKVIVPGLGSDASLVRLIPVTTDNGRILPHLLGERPTFRWPDISDALTWAKAGKIVYLQPRNAKHDIDNTNLHLCEQLVAEHPNLRLSVQMHKILRVR